MVKQLEFSAKDYSKHAEALSSGGIQLNSVISDGLAKGLVSFASTPLAFAVTSPWNWYNSLLISVGLDLGLPKEWPTELGIPYVQASDLEMGVNLVDGLTSLLARSEAYHQIVWDHRQQICLFYCNPAWLFCLLAIPETRLKFYKSVSTEISHGPDQRGLGKGITSGESLEHYG